MNFIFFLFALVAIIVVPMAAVFYGYRALRWGFDRHRGWTWLAVLLLFALLMTAWSTFGLLFQGCYVARTGMISTPIGNCPH